jgi:stage IV sporulation protein FB
VIFAEPGHTDYDLHFGLFGIPVRVHPMFWLVGLILGSALPDVKHILLWIAAFFVSILCHEMGHALMFQGYGIRSSIVLYGFGGLAIPSGADGPRYHTAGTAGRILISFAGAGAGFLIILLVLGLMYAFGSGNRIEFSPPFRILPGLTFLPELHLKNYYVTFFVNSLFWLWIYWGMMNLLPVYPLDGGQISQEICIAVSPREGVLFSLKLSITVAGAITIGCLWFWLRDLHQAQGASLKDTLRSFPFFMTLLFGYLAYQSYMTLLEYRSHRGW